MLVNGDIMVNHVIIDDGCDGDDNECDVDAGTKPEL